MSPASRRSFNERAANHRASLYGGEVIYNGTKYDQGAASRGFGTLNLADGAVIETTILIWRIIKTFLKAEPRSSEVITHKGEDWIIRETRNEDFESEYIIRATRS